MEDVECSLQLVVYVEDGSNISASVAIVWSRPNGDEVLISEPVLEPVHNQLMRSGNEGDVVDVIELGRNLGSEEPSSASWGHCPRLDILGIRPHKIAEWTLVRDLHSSVNQSNLINGLDFGRKSSMNAENFSLDNSSNAKVIEDFGAILPWVGISIFSNRLIVESVHGRDLSGLVVSSEQSDVSWVLQLQAKQKLESLH